MLIPVIKIENNFNVNNSNMNSTCDVVIQIVDSLTNSVRFTEEIIKIIHDPESYFRSHDVNMFDQLLTEWTNHHCKYIDIHMIYTLTTIQRYMSNVDKCCPERTELMFIMIMTMSDVIVCMESFVERFHEIQSEIHDNQHVNGYNAYVKLLDQFRIMTKSYREKYKHIYTGIEYFKHDVSKHFERVPGPDSEINDTISFANNHFA